jgi:hypothetical protein
MENKEPYFIKIMKVPVGSLLRWPEEKLILLENKITNEVCRSNLALRWVRGIRKVKKAQDEENKPNN